MMRLLDFIFPPRMDELTLRSVSDEELLSLVAPRIVEYTRPATVALFAFSNPSVRATIHEAKYHGNTRAFRLLGTAVAEYLRDADEVGQKLDIVLVPVPLGKERRKKRGFNQAEHIVRCALKQLGEDREVEADTTLLTRTRETVSQVTLPREERAKNMQGAFEAAHPADPTYLYVVIDDVITTGATLQAAIDALTTAGAKHLLPLALAH